MTGGAAVAGGVSDGDRIHANTAGCRFPALGRVSLGDSFFQSIRGLVEYVKSRIQGFSGCAEIMFGIDRRSSNIDQLLVQ